MSISRSRAGSKESIFSGSQVILQPSGIVAYRVTSSMAAVPVFNSSIAV